ncbi:MAG: hypothetical protein AAFN78_15405 [Pseudomonadota bacterium]
MEQSNADTTDWQAGQKRNTQRLAGWTGAWLVTMALVNFGPTYVWDHNTALTGIAIVLNILVGFGMIAANRRHLLGLDEMQRAIQLGAMALTLGVGLVLGLAYSNLDVTGMIPFDAEISHLVVLMALTYLGGVLAGTRKYR